MYNNHIIATSIHNIVYMLEFMKHTSTILLLCLYSQSTSQHHMRLCILLFIKLMFREDQVLLAYSR